MAQKFLIELYCHSDAQSIRNMIADVIQDGMIKEVVELSDEAAQPGVQRIDYWFAFMAFLAGLGTGFLVCILGTINR